MSFFSFNDLETALSVTGFKFLSGFDANRFGKYWGVYQRGLFETSPILTASHVEEVTTQVDYQITNAPLEEGSFTSVNKVASPRQHKIRLLCDGTESGIIVNLLPSYLSDRTGIRRDFLNGLETICSNTNLYQIRVPERTYNNVNMIGYSINRSSDSGMTLLAVDMTFQEVRQTKPSGWTQVKNPYQAKAENQGSVQPK